MKKKVRLVLRNKGSLTIPKVIVVFCLNFLYHYGILSVSIAVLILVLTLLTGNIRLIAEAPLDKVLPTIIGVVIFYPARLLRRYATENL